MRTYSLSAGTVPVAMADDLVVGSVHDGRNYRIMLVRKSSKPAFWPAKTTGKGRA